MARAGRIHQSAINLRRPAMRLPLLVALVLAVAPASAQVPARDTITVAPASATPTLGAALRVARPGATIIVASGVYREPTILVDKPVTILGAAGAAAVFDGEGARQIMTVTANDVTLRGLTFRNVGASMVDDRAAIKLVSAERCVIEGNRLENAFFGIYLSNVRTCRIAHNEIHASSKREQWAGNGIHLWSSSGVTIDSNVVTGHRDGIYFEFVHNSVIAGNLSEHNLRYGLHFMFSDDCHYRENTFRENGSGVAVMFTHRVEMTHNRFESNWGSAAYGLLLKEIKDSRLEGNVFHRNTIALLADGADHLVVTGNEFRSNGWALKLLASTDQATIEGNNFVGNTFDLATNSRAGSTTLRGNYWDNYQGYDLDRDGFGDVPERPVRLFSFLVERYEPAMILMRSFFAGLLDAAERALPALTSEGMADARPSMRPLPTGTSYRPSTAITTAPTLTGASARGTP